MQICFPYFQKSCLKKHELYKKESNNAQQKLKISIFFFLFHFFLLKKYIYLSIFLIHFVHLLFSSLTDIFIEINLICNLKVSEINCLHHHLYYIMGTHDIISCISFQPFDISISEYLHVCNQILGMAIP